MAEDVIKKSLRYSVYDGAAYSVMDGLTSSFITPFAVALKASVNLIAALTYVPQLVGALVQLFAAKLVEISKDRRKILVVSSFIHAILWIPLLLIPYATPGQKYLLIVYVSLQTLVLQLMNPIGNSLLGDIVPKYERGKFFGMRNRVVEITSFIAALIAGFTLEHFSTKNEIIGFTILFVIAFIARILSAIFKLMVHNPESDLSHEDKFSLVDFVKKMDKTNYGHFVIYISLFKFAVSIASPFFAVYMLKNLGFNYLQFTALTASELIASFIAMGVWGKLIDGKSTKYVLYISGILTPFIPLFWLFSGNFYYLLVVEAFSGLSWAGFNLSSSNFIFDAVKPENRVRCIAYYKFFEGMSIFLGAAFGSFLINVVPAWMFLSGIPFVFIVSGALRLAISIIYLPTLNEARLIEMGVGHSFFKRYITIRPSEGFVFEVIGKYRKTDEKARGTSDAQTQDYRDRKRQKPIDKDESESYNKKLVKLISSDISPKSEQHTSTDMHEIEHITEEIEGEKGKK